MAYAYYRTLTITSNATLHPATQTNFPVLVKISHTSMKTVGNGGHIQNSGTSASGPAVTMPYDLIFTSDSGGTTKIPWEVDFYDGTNGVLWAWVQVASCATSTVFYTFYGDAAVNSAQNTGSFTPANVWDTNFKRIYHLSDGTTLLATDSTGNANGTLVNTPTAATGQIDGGASFASASSQRITFADTGLPTTTGVRTLECWTNITSTPGGTNNFGYGVASSGQMFQITTTGSSPNIHVRLALFGTTIDGTQSLSTGTWYYSACVYDGTNGIVYVNGVLDKSSAASPNTTLGGGRIGDRPDDANFFNGVMDECRISNTNRSANWITSTYNAQSDPTTFCAIGTETANGALAIAILIASYRRRRI